MPRLAAACLNVLPAHIAARISTKTGRICQEQCMEDWAACVGRKLFLFHHTCADLFLIKLFLLNYFLFNTGTTGNEKYKKSECLSLNEKGIYVTQKVGFWF